MNSAILILTMTSFLLNCKNASDVTTELNVTNTNNIEMSEQENIIDSIVYVATTRGFFEKIILTKDQIALTNDRQEESFRTMTIDSSYYETISKSIAKIGLESLESFEAPSEMHQVDGAALAQIEVYSNNEVYNTQRFDHKFPPKQLSSITDIIYELSEKITKQ